MEGWGKEHLKGILYGAGELQFSPEGRGEPSVALLRQRRDPDLSFREAVLASVPHCTEELSRMVGMVVISTV